VSTPPSQRTVWIVELNLLVGVLDERGSEPALQDVTADERRRQTVPPPINMSPDSGAAEEGHAFSASGGNRRGSRTFPR